jgi:hypothetical protein
VKKKRIYLVQIAQEFPGGPLVWQYATESTKSMIIIDGLNSGQKYNIRVAAINAAGASDWSDVISSRVL